MLDDFADPAAWTLSASDDVKAALRPAAGPHGSALCIDFDFGKVTGYVSARRSLPIDFPARFEFTLNVRGDAPPNALQFKLVDASRRQRVVGEPARLSLPARLAGASVSPARHRLRLGSHGRPHSFAAPNRSSS